MREEQRCQENSLRLVSGGIDWITLTTTSPAVKRRMVEYFNGMLQKDLLNGYRSKRGGVHGFMGTRATSGVLGEREDRMLIQVSSEAAQGAMSLCHGEANCTRIDIQVTVRVEEGQVPRYLQQLEQDARSAPAIRGVKPRAKAVHGDQGTETLFIGSRTSDVFIRCYDKFEESGDERYKDCVRLECELKGKTSKALWKACMNGAGGTSYLLSVLRYVLERRGLAVDWVPWFQESETIPPKEKSSLQKKLGWFAQQVAPSVDQIVRDWGFFTAFHVLFGKALTEGHFSAIMNAWSLSVGN